MKLTVPYHTASQLPPFAEGGASIIRRNRSGCSGIWLRRHHLRQKIMFPMRLPPKTNPPSNEFNPPLSELDLCSPTR